MMNLHPTAIVSPTAVLGKGVEIGPYCIIGENVLIGDETKIGSNVSIQGWTKIGKRCQIFQGAVIGTQPQDVHYKGEKSFVEIGNDNIIREYVTIHRGTEKESATHIGNNNLLMAYCHIAHNCWVGNGVVIANMGALAGYVRVEDKVIIGGMVGVHQYVRIGAYAIVGGLSKVIKDIPPFTLADGNPVHLWNLNVVGLRRAGFSPATRNHLARAYKIIFRSGLNTSQALKKIENELENIPEVEYLCNFIRTSKRGICKEGSKKHK
ncbi:acyl-ACP--UDP-N-acetylglucosamine O-acyltransferase [Candidatus Aerophobetes bacterium]|nr:acyl-ACP--UDP-N-acetylglucosamine O-acyltransferase [Candidatus Aerophobetes bacterium]